jgi:hypothetical protein
MTGSELIEFSGWLFASWSAGFVGGWLMASFKQAVDVIS